MPVYEASIQVTGQSTAPYVVASLRGPSNARAKLIELEIWTLTAPTTSLQLVLAWSTALGTTLSNNMTGVGRDPSNTGAGGQLIGTYSTRPTVGTSTTFFKRVVFPTSLGSGVMRSFDLTNPLLLPLGSAVNGDLCIVQTTATASGDMVINASWDE